LDHYFLQSSMLVRKKYKIK